MSFDAIQGSVICVYANANGLDMNGPKGVALQVPNASTANLEDLVTATFPRSRVTSLPRLQQRQLG